MDSLGPGDQTNMRLAGALLWVYQCWIDCITSKFLHISLPASKQWLSSTCCQVPQLQQGIVILLPLSSGWVFSRQTAWKTRHPHTSHKSADSPEHLPFSSLPPVNLIISCCTSIRSRGYLFRMRPTPWSLISVIGIKFTTVRLSFQGLKFCFCMHSSCQWNSHAQNSACNLVSQSLIQSVAALFSPVDIFTVTLLKAVLQLQLC